jgi:hypothetical protein
MAIMSRPINLTAGRFARFTACGMPPLKSPQPGETPLVAARAQWFLQSAGDRLIGEEPSHRRQ